MKIAFAMINANRRDGSARAVNEVAERLGTRHEVQLFARKAEDLDLDRVRWRRIPGPGWPEVVDFTSYHVTANWRIRPSDFDIVHSIGSNTLRANVITIQNVQPAKDPILKRLSPNERVSAPRRFTRYLYSKVAGSTERSLYEQRPGRRKPMFLPVSRGVAADLKKHYDIGDAPLRVIPNAADIKCFKPLSPDRKAVWRSANGLAADDQVAVFVGGEWARKGLDLAIQAIALVGDSRLKLLVCGDDADRKRFVQLAADLGVSGRVRFAGFRSDVAQAMAASDLFLFPSWYEAFSLATIEAAACGLPILASKINGAEDFVEPGVNGFFLEHDAAHIAGVLKIVLAKPESLRQMGESARRLVEESYTWEKVALATEAAYHAYLNAA